MELTSKKIDDKEVKPNIEHNVRGKFIPSNLKEVICPKRLEIYSRILTNARLPRSNLEHIQDLNFSDNFICGRASQKVYSSIIFSRSFDSYGQSIKTRISDDKNNIASLQSQMKNKDLQINDLKVPMEDQKKLITPIWKIGYKPVKYAPPGLTPPMKRIMNSEGNEKYFSYDGCWKNGNMEGEGLYQFCDGFTHEGIFKRNLPNGYGQATYSGGTIYIGEWKNGYPHGKGRAVYKYGIVYEGDWKQGKRHGNGTLTYPNSYYCGEFRRGHYHGKGTFISKGNGLKYVGNFERSFVTGTGTIIFPNGRNCRKEWPRDESFNNAFTLHEAIKHIEQEWRAKVMEEKRTKRSLRDTLETVKMEERVNRIRDQLKKQRKTEKLQKKLKRRDLLRKHENNMNNMIVAVRNETQLESMV